MRQVGTNGRQSVRAQGQASRASKRVAAIAIAGFVGLTGAALFSSPAVAADPQTVTYRGGCALGLGVLYSRSTPDRSSLTVPAETTVTFVNDLGRTAVLDVGGAKVSVPAGSAAPVKVRRGPVDALMKPDCSLLGGIGLDLIQDIKKSTVNVTPAVVPPAARESSPAARPNAAAPGALVNGSTRAPQSPGRRTTAAPKPSKQAPAEVQAPVEVPSAPIGDAAGAPVAIEPIVKTSNATSHSHGLVALIATICLIGVCFAAVRTVVAQRSARLGRAMSV